MRSCGDSASKAISHKDGASVFLATCGVTSSSLSSCVYVCAISFSVASVGSDLFVGIDLGVAFRTVPVGSGDVVRCSDCMGLDSLVGFGLGVALGVVSADSGCVVRCSDEGVSAQVGGAVEFTPLPTESTEVPAGGRRLSRDKNRPDLKKAKTLSRFLGIACYFCDLKGDREFATVQFRR